MTQGYQTLEQAREAAKQNPTTVLYGVLAVVHLESGLYHFIVPGVVALETLRDAIIIEMWRLTEETIWEQIFPTMEEVPFSMSKDETYEIIGSRWFTNVEYLGIGVVAIRTHNPMFPQEWKAYVGLSLFQGETADADAQDIARKQQIAAWGSPLLPREAHGFFPHLKLEDYKNG